MLKLKVTINSFVAPGMFISTVFSYALSKELFLLLPLLMKLFPCGVDRLYVFEGISELIDLRRAANVVTERVQTAIAGAAVLLVVLHSRA